MKLILPILSMLLVLSAHAAPSSGTVILDEQGVKNLRLQTVKVERSDFEVTTFALGKTEAIPDKRSVLSSRIPGRVVETELQIGAYVEKGDKLVRLESRQPGNPPPSVWLTAPANGNILSVKSVLGSPVEPTEVLAELADLSEIYLIVTVPQLTAGKVKQGTKARVRFPVRPDREYEAELLRYSVCPCPNPACALGMDLSTRNEDEEENLNSAGLVFTIENKDNQLRPQMNAECALILERRKDVLSVPREAVHGGPDDRHVYIRHHTIPNAFDRVSVTTGLSGNDRVEIVEGLFPGDEVVTRGSYSLGFAGNSGGISLKEAMDAAHGHEHNEDGSEMTPEQKAAAKKAGADGASDHEETGMGLLGIFFMLTTAILAIALVMVLRRRTEAKTTTA